MIEGQELVTQPLGMNHIRDLRDVELKKYDWYAIREMSGGEVIPDDIKAYMQAWRDLPSNCTPELDDAGNLILSSIEFPVLG